MQTLLVSHADCLGHETPPGHPESVARLRAVLAALETEEFTYLQRAEAPRADVEALTRVHPLIHVETILNAVPDEGYHYIDGDTVLSPGSAEAALRAAGAVTYAVDQVMAGEVQNAFCAVRPPGHHAEPDRAMGFCLFNNAAIGAQHARHAHGCKRVAVMDFDVHHGNGTQEAFQSDPALFYASTHQMPLYPGTGGAEEHGIGNIVNCPLAPGSGSREFRAAFTGRILPALEQFQPDFLLISAGFDGHLADPLANLCLSEDDYAWATAELVGLADRFCEGRIVSTLEGGYDLRALASSARAHVRELMRLNPAIGEAR